MKVKLFCCGVKPEYAGNAVTTNRYKCEKCGKVYRMTLLEVPKEEDIF